MVNTSGHIFHINTGKSVRFTKFSDVQIQFKLERITNEAHRKMYHCITTKPNRASHRFTKGCHGILAQTRIRYVRSESDVRDESLWLKNFFSVVSPIHLLVVNTLRFHTKEILHDPVHSKSWRAVNLGSTLLKIAISYKNFAQRVTD